MSASPTQFQSTHGALAPRNPDEPVDQLAQERQQERINAPNLTKYLNKTLDSIASLDQSENLRIHNVMVRCTAYYDDRWDGKIENGEWVDNESVDGQILPKDNEYKKQIDKLQTEMCRSRIRYQVTPVDKSSAELREAAKFAERRIEINQSRIETFPFIQAENKSLLLKTWTLRYSFFDQNAESQEKSIEIQAIRGLIGQESQVTVCRTCEMSIDKSVDIDVADPVLDERRVEYKATEAQARNCPRCGDTEVKTITAPASQSMNVEQEKKSAGRVVTVRPDATMVQMDLNARDISGSSFIRWRLSMRRCDWEAMFPDTLIPSAKESEEGRHRTQSQSYPSNSVAFGTAVDESGGDQFEKIEGELVWLDPKVYQRYENKETETLGDDRVLPAGTKLAKHFPVGLCVARIGNKILDLYPSNKNKCWTMCVYGLREHALHGSGTVALLGPQDIINQENAAIQASHIYGSLGRELLRSGAIEGGQWPRFDEVAYVNAPEEVNDIAAWAAGRIQPNPLSGDVYAFREAMRGSLQDAAGTSSLSMQGAADMKVLGTATGVEASRDQAVGRMIPNRQLQAFMGTEWARQILELEQENYTPETFLELADKSDEHGEIEFTERGVVTFFNTYCTDFIIEPVEGSWMPQTPAQVRANNTEFASIAAKLPNPELLSKLAPGYGVDYDVDEWGAAQRNASMRLEEYAKISSTAWDGESAITPDTVQAVLANIPEWARVDPEMDQHTAFVDFYSDWWLSDEGRNADSLLRLVVKETVRLHKDGTVTQAQKTNEDTAKAQIPNLVAENTKRDVEHEQQIDHAEEEADLADEREAAKMMIMSQVMPPEAPQDASQK